jgi:hypothetical protein
VPNAFRGGLRLVPHAYLAVKLDLRYTYMHTAMAPENRGHAAQFAISTATIVSGAVAERVKFISYALYAFFLTAWVYPGKSYLPMSLASTCFIVPLLQFPSMPILEKTSQFLCHDSVQATAWRCILAEPYMHGNARFSGICISLESIGPMQC